jgi:uncharacterized protein
MQFLRVTLASVSFLMCGCVLSYTDGTNWPAQYAGTLLVTRSHAGAISAGRNEHPMRYEAGFDQGATSGMAADIPAIETAPSRQLAIVTSSLGEASASDSLTTSVATWVTCVLFLAGVVSGLSGFAFSAVAACILWLLPPLQAVPLLMLLSTCNQFVSIGSLRRDMRLIPSDNSEGAVPYIFGGLIGAPIGLLLLRSLPATEFAAGLGIFLTAYAVFSLLKRDGVRLGFSGWRPAIAIGAAGGVIGGFSAFPGSMLVVYLDLLGKTKTETRGVVQPYILSLQVISLALLAVTSPAVFNRNYWLLFALTLPSVLAGTSVGVAVYQRISDINFRRTVLVLLIASGISLVIKALMQI